MSGFESSAQRSVSNGEYLCQSATSSTRGRVHPVYVRLPDRCARHLTDIVFSFFCTSEFLVREVILRAIQLHEAISSGPDHVRGRDMGSPHTSSLETSSSCNGYGRPDFVLEDVSEKDTGSPPTISTFLPAKIGMPIVTFSSTHSNHFLKAMRLVLRPERDNVYSPLRT